MSNDNGAATVRSASGFGDALYLNSIIKYLTRRYPSIAVRTKYPTVFHYLPVETEQFTKKNCDLAFNYGGAARQDQTTNQYQDLLRAADLSKHLAFQVTWCWTESEISERVMERARGRKIALLSSPHLVFGRTDGRGDALVPNWKKFNKCLDYLKDEKYFIVQVGKLPKLYKFTQVDADLTSQTEICDVMNIAMMSDVGIGQTGFILPLMEGFDIPCFVIMSRRGLNQANDSFICNITPKKVLTKATSRAVIDDEDDRTILGEFIEILR